MDYKTTLENYIVDEILRKRNTKLDENDDLIGAGILDSLGVLQIVAFIEKAFNLQVPDEDVVYENFHSLATIEKYLQTLTNSR
jgi:acyl carrier protein